MGEVKMFNTVKKMIGKEVRKVDLVKFILSQEEHNWIREDQYVHAHFTEFLEGLPKRVLEDVFLKKVTFFVRSTGKYACSVTPLQQNIIIVFPEVYQLLTKTFSGWAKAVLAHEIGHIILSHTESMEDPMEAQVDADKFACDMGYLDQIEEFLHEQPESIEKRVRLSFLTSYYFSEIDQNH